MAASFASSPFRRLASRRLSFRGFPPYVVAYPICSLSVSMPDTTRPSALYTAPMAWSMSIQNDANTRPQRTWHVLLQDVTFTALSHARRWDACPVGGQWPQKEDSTSLSLWREDTNGEHLENAHLASPHLRWRRDALQLPGVQGVRLSRNTCVHIPDSGLRCFTWNTRGLIGSPASPNFPGKTHLLHSDYQEQRHRLSPRNSCERF